ncbi:hypothetical protein M0813_20532 [Anaeramoeba flamelloides]|uniref:Uncharacterized protein n=1 Tax=Anaeramoeba flamelloides TaxID=1746091 RepID=A0ABQ8YKU8_9EUKA|nr:hypothetical protein M0813_20532 [Anaeramoeba flamelloides]
MLDNESNNLRSLDLTILNSRNDEELSLEDDFFAQHYKLKLDQEEQKEIIKLKNELFRYGFLFKKEEDKKSSLIDLLIDLEYLPKGDEVFPIQKMTKNFYLINRVIMKEYMYKMFNGEETIDLCETLRLHFLVNYRINKRRRKPNLENRQKLRKKNKQLSSKPSTFTNLDFVPTSQGNQKKIKHSNINDVPPYITSSSENRNLPKENKKKCKKKIPKKKKKFTRYTQKKIFSLDPPKKKIDLKSQKKISISDPRTKNFFHSQKFPKSSSFSSSKSDSSSSQSSYNLSTSNSLEDSLYVTNISSSEESNNEKKTIKKKPKNQKKKK